MISSFHSLKGSKVADGFTSDTMPVYEYEPTEHDCVMCPNRVAAIQSIDEPALVYCPDCGLPVKRVVSRASFKVSTKRDPGDHGFSVWKRSEFGVWEKTTGGGADYLVGDKNEIEEIKAERTKPAKTFDLDNA